MRKTKIIFVIVMVFVLCLACMLTACKKKGNDEETSIYTASNYKEDTLTVYSTVEALGKTFTGCNFVGAADDLVAFSKEDENGNMKYMVYNLKTATAVGKFSNTDTVTYQIGLVNADGYYFLVQKAVETEKEEEEVTIYTYYMYDAAGTEIASVTKEDVADFTYSAKLDFVQFDKSIYRLGEDGTLNLYKEMTELSNAIPNGLSQYGKYYYNLENGVKIFNSDLEATAYYAFPSYAQNAESIVLNNGDVFVQYVVERFASDKAYDFARLGIKYTLYQAIVSVDGGVDEVDLGYFVYDGMSRLVAEAEEEEGLNGINGKFNNVFYGTAIVEKMLDENETAIETIIVSDSAKIEATFKFNAYIPNQQQMQIIGNDRIIVRDTLNRAYLFTFSGKKIGEIANYITKTNRYIVSDEKIYDFDLNEVYAYDANKFEYAGKIGNTILFTKENKNGEIYGFIFKDGASEPEKKYSVDNDVFTPLNNELFVITKEDGKVGLYNFVGDSLKTFSFECQIVIRNTTDDNVVLFSILNQDNELEYYVIK